MFLKEHGERHLWGRETYFQLCSAVQTEQAMYAQRGKDKLIVAEQILYKQGFYHLCSNIRFPVLFTCRQITFK